MKLYRVSVKVQPTPNHPKFWVMEFGWLQVWIFGDDEPDAARRALAVVEQLQYEIPGDEVTVHPIGAYNPLIRRDCETTEQTAQEFGLGLFLVACPTGTEDDDLT
ncbi:MAG: hypothetical protein ACYDH9_08110 [Limisphaerales bacterium]